MNIELLRNDIPEVEKPGLDIFDPRFDDIVGSIDRAEYLEAAKQVEEVLQSGVYDIRVIGYFAYGIFLEQGPAILGDLFDALSHLLNNNFEQIGPVKNKQKQAQAGLRWFLAQLIKKMQYEEKRNSDDWQNWQDNCNTDQVEAAIANCDIFRRALTANLEDKAGPLIELLSKVNAILDSFHALAKPVIEEVEEETPTPSEESPEANTTQTPNNQQATSSNDSDDIDVNSELHKLSLKIEAFQTLCRQGDFTKASIVTEDLEDIIANFTPQKYFPQSFSQYFAALAVNAAELSPHWQERNTLGWQALERLYQVDPESFLNLDI
jgi:hypothetical protein